MNSTNIFAISALINGIVSITFGILVISKNWRDRMNQIFFFMTISFAVWSFSYWQWQLSTDYDTAMMWVRILSIGSLFIPILFYHWVIKLVNANTAVNKILLWLAYGAAMVILLFAKSNLFIAGLERKSFFQFWPNPGIAYNVYFSYIYLGLILYTVYLLLRSYKTAGDANKKGQILYIIFAVIFGFGGGLSNFPLWWGINIPPYGNFLAAAFPFLFGYSILKYKLFNAKTIATEILVFFIAVILLVEATLSASIIEAVLKTGIFIIVSIFGYLLIQSVYREVAQREKIELLAKDLEAANQRLRELDTQKTEFISFATHQLRAPLTAMKGYASLIIEGDMGEVPAKVSEAVSRMFESAKTMTSVVDDYLNVSRIELGSMKYNFEPLDMNALVNEVAGELKPNIMKAGLKFDYKVVGEGPWMVSVDPDKWKQVIANIIDNSVKYTPRGSLLVKLERVPNADGTIPVRFSVTDTGIGIAPGVMPKLFQKFSRADNANKQNIHGTGLGLFIVREIVNAHHGRVWAESDGEGKGSKFIVELPVIKG
jgi:signal transduction histidine kinase